MIRVVLDFFVDRYGLRLPFLRLRRVLRVRAFRRQEHLEAAQPLLSRASTWPIPLHLGEPADHRAERGLRGGSPSSTTISAPFRRGGAAR